MARPVKQRRICALPQTSEFGPYSNPEAEPVEFALDEYEVIRLIDYLGFTQEECAGQMKVARTTVQAIYDSARKKLADALVNGKRLPIRGGAYELCAHAGRCRGGSCSQRACKAMQCESGEMLCNRCTYQQKEVNA